MRDSSCCAIDGKKDTSSRSRGRKIVDSAQVVRSGQQGWPRVFLPIHVAVVLASQGELLAELDARKDALLALDLADELDGAVHIAGHIDQVAHMDVARHGRHLGHGRNIVVEDSAQGVALAGIGNRG